MSCTHAGPCRPYCGPHVEGHMAEGVVAAMIRRRKEREQLDRLRAAVAVPASPEVAAASLRRSTKPNLAAVASAVRPGMSPEETLALLDRLAAGGSHVLVTLYLDGIPGGGSPMFDSPVDAGYARECVVSASKTADNIGNPASFYVRRDETALGITH